MTMTEIPVKEQMETLLKSMRDVAAKAEAENRDFTDDERTDLSSKLKQLDELKRTQKKIDESDRIKSALDEDHEQLAAGDAKSLNDLALAGARFGLGATRGKSLGERFTEDAGFKAFLKQFPNGTIPDSAKGLHSPPVQVGGLKALLTGESATSGGALITPEFYGLVPPAYQRPLNLLDVITVGQTGTDQIDYARMTSVTNAAAATPEATISGAKPSPDTTNTAGTKPESSMAFERVSTTVKTIAHWMAATKRALADAGQLRTLIDNFLRYGLQEELEDQVVSGDDTGENFEGILEVSGTQDQAWDTDIFVTTRKALTKVRVQGRAIPNAFLIHPADDERIDLERDNQDRFFGNGPFGTGPSTLWGVPRVVTEAVPEGTGIVGDLRTCVLWDREQATVSASDSHSDFFIRNLIAVLAELRAGFGVLRPSALVIVDLDAAS